MYVEREALLQLWGVCGWCVLHVVWCAVCGGWWLRRGAQAPRRLVAPARHPPEVGGKNGGGGDSRQRGTMQQFGLHRVIISELRMRSCLIGGDVSAVGAGARVQPACGGAGGAGGGRRAQSSVRTTAAALSGYVRLP